MTLKHLNAKERWNNYLKRRVQIVTIYNENSSVHSEQPGVDYSTLNQPELLHCFFDSDVKGGVLIEQLVGNENVALITFAAIEQDQRGRGLCTEILCFAEQQLQRRGIQLVGVQLNDFDDATFWKARGFTDAVEHQNVTVLVKPY
ncbi:hypothetical protein VA249_45470 (plasmid) [Vibrio alfacsensis]|uniref:GNAT family N-acetyltransferase n=1 Tax=Vibrio alfacsensis TaxID=1074311 RepID=UPI001BF16730|nr:GNAT family N-acetyltransferase [Vibrio alfacsensis]BBM67901.1 hypothetical protein VA249_45470 [Vibrio alfacsensis]